jgi:hypothetical protein
MALPFVFVSEPITLAAQATSSSATAERINRLLMLMRLDANGEVNERRYGQRIRHVLQTNSGHHPATRRNHRRNGQHSRWN